MRWVCLLLYFLGLQREYLDIYHRSVITVDSHVGDGIDDIHSLIGLSEYRVMVIKVRCTFCGLYDEELTSIGVRPSIGHGKSSLEVSQSWSEFILEFLSVDTLPSSPRRSRVSSLDHEVLDDSMKHCCVIVSLSSESDKVRAGFRSLFREELDLDSSESCFDYGNSIALLWKISLWHME